MTKSKKGGNVRQTPPPSPRVESPGFRNLTHGFERAPTQIYATEFDRSCVEAGIYHVRF
ncbi:MAG: hypothetical protein JWN49_512 [Parcubacteria group bacterium]|nr:hypothetical protein [Parcubacteria group bacterium]